MAPTLYHLDYSPPSRSVLITAKAIGLELNIKTLDLGQKEHLTPEFLKINPQHTVPTLVDDDSFIIWDSHAIMIYLVEKYARGNELYPENVKKRGTINQRLHLDSCITSLRGTIIKAVIYTDQKQVSEDNKRQILEHYDCLEAFLNNSDWIAAEHVTLADLSLVPPLQALAVVVPIDEQKYQKITHWIEKVEALPYFDVNKEGAEKLKNLILEKLNE